MMDRVAISIAAALSLLLTACVTRATFTCHYEGSLWVCSGDATAD